VARFKVQMPSREFYRGWGFVALLGLVITVAVFIYQGGVQNVQAGLSEGGCTVTVNGTEVNVRTAPSTSAPVVAVLNQGDIRTASQTVQNGFRALGTNQWAYDAYLTPVPGSNCG
jgi:hypothetical protein